MELINIVNRNYEIRCLADRLNAISARRKRKGDAVYRRCPLCGASLDPCEICDCKKEAAPEVTTPKAAQEKYPHQIYQRKGEMSNGKVHIPVRR